MNEARPIDTLQPGDHVEIVGMGGRLFEVIRTDEPELVRVRTDTGREFSAWGVCVARVWRQEWQQ